MIPTGALGRWLPWGTKTKRTFKHLDGCEIVFICLKYSFLKGSVNVCCLASNSSNISQTLWFFNHIIAYKHDFEMIKSSVHISSVQDELSNIIAYS